MADLKCRKCGSKDIASKSIKKRRLWAIYLGLNLIAFGVILIIWGRDPNLRRTGSIITVIPGFAILGYGLRKEPKYYYVCKSCGKKWTRSAKKGPEEGDPKYIEYQTEHQLMQLTHGDSKAAEWFYEHPTPLAVESLIRCLGERKPDWETTRLWTISALKKIGDNRALKPLIKAATDKGREYEKVRAKALSALSTFTNDEVRKILEEATNDKSLNIRKVATKSLEELNRSV